MREFWIDNTDHSTKVNSMDPKDIISELEFLKNKNRHIWFFDRIFKSTIIDFETLEYLFDFSPRYMDDL